LTEDEVARLIVKAFKEKELLKVGNRSYLNAFKYPESRFDPKDLTPNGGSPQTLDPPLLQPLTDPSKLFTDKYVIPPSSLIFKWGDRVYDKRWWGGVYGGLTDASAVIQSALNALTPNRTWKEKVVLKGAFDIYRPIEVPSYTVLQGGRLVGKTVRSTAMLLVDNKEYVEIRDVIIDGNSNFYCGLALTKNTSHVLIDNCEFKDCYDRNLWMWDGGVAGARVKDVVVRNCRIGKRAPVAGRPAISNVDPSVDINQTEDVRLEGCTFIGDLSPPSGFSYPLVLLWTDDVTNYRTTITNCHFRDHHQNAVRVVGTVNAKIVGNTFFNLGCAIQFQDHDSYRALIADNIFMDTVLAVNSFDQDLVFDVMIANNIAYRTRQGAFGVAGKGKVELLNNVMVENNTENKPWYAGGSQILIRTNRALFCVLKGNFVFSYNTNGAPVTLNALSSTPSAEAIFEGNVFNRTNPFYGANHPTLGNKSNAELYVIAKDYLSKYKMGRNYAFTESAPEKVLLKTGYENSGSATITAGATYVDVTHNLAITPDINRIKITPKDNLGGRSFWVDNVTATTFRINISSTDTVNHVFGWSYE